MPKIGETLRNRYRLDAMLGEGGMGTVYQAFDTFKNRPVAVKEMRLAEFPADENATRQEEETRQRKSQPVTRGQALKQFRKEADLLVRLHHPHLPEVEDYFDIADQGYFVMTLVEGRNLAQVVAENHRPLPEVLVRGWLEQIFSALEYCHSQGVIHRDVKPENLILTAAGQIYLVDFGIAKSKTESSGSSTTVGARAYTEFYSPPEQRPGGGGTDERCDIYGLGAVMYFLLTATPPQDAQMRSAGETIKWPSSQNPHISTEMDNFIMRCLRLDKRERPQSVAEARALLKGELPGLAPQLEPANRLFGQDDLFQAALKAPPAPAFPEVQAAPVLQPQPPAGIAGPQPPARRKRSFWQRRSLWAVGGGLLLLVLAGVLLGASLAGKSISPRTALRQLQAAEDRYQVLETYALIVDTPHGLLANDRGVDMGLLSVALSRGPAHGLLKLSSDGSFTYVPEQGFSGMDGFSYQYVPLDAGDSSLRSAPIPVSIEVTPLVRLWLPLIAK